MPVSKNLKGHVSKISAEDRADLLGQQGVVVWLTGLSGSGKSTLAYELERRLIESGRLAYTLDGDNVRQGLCRDLGFSPDDRHENLRRIGEVASLFADAGVIVITAFISPYRSDRDRAREIAKGRFLEVYLDVPVEVCERRDPKGLYARARAGEIKQFTGVSAPYEAPEKPELALDTDAHEPGHNVQQIIEMLTKRGVIREKPKR